ncbi:MAG: alpha/beta fold hydrolase [Marinifilaceae bacterium]
MNLLVRTILLLFVMVWANSSFAQSELKFANLGDFKTTGGEVIKEAKIGYRTVGELNSDKSNAILWPTWFTGTSEQILQWGILNNTIDTTGLYVIIVDALGNGVSSSPSNTSKFPAISIRDMVNSQRELLVNHLKIDHLHAVMGISMGGMQTYEWLVAYPDYMDKAIAIIGTPKQSFYDILFWQSQADLIENAGKNKRKIEFAMKRVYDLFTMNLYTPSFLANNVKPENAKEYMEEQYAKIIHHADYLVQMKAMIKHDIYKSSNSTVDNIDDVIKAELLVVVNEQDHTVNPLNSIAISRSLKSKLKVLDTENGHALPFFDHKQVKKEVVPFLKK